MLYEVLKAVAARTVGEFYIKYTNFSADEFWGIIKATKHIKNVCFGYSSIPFYCEKDFGEGMENCKIEYICLYCSGGAAYSNWAANPIRFENLISSISKCAPLVKSLKTLEIGGCDITKDNAQEILNKYKLNGITLTGV